MIKKLLFVFLSTIMYGQTADQIINTHFENTGGYNNWNNLNSIFIDGTVSIGLGESYPVQIYQKRPYYKAVNFLVDSDYVLNEGYDGNYGWTYSPEQKKNIRLMEYVPDSFETDILNYADKGFKAEYTGVEEVDGISAYKVELIKNDNTSYFWFDTKNYTLIKEETALETVRYKENKKSNHLEFSYRIETTPKGGKEYVLIINTIKPNYAIQSNTFQFD